ncbi:hypothetical protein [Paraburkholderia phytofirmans]|uniref:hypothetical protein n=1 Tax=Paraburkholderia phytofirmans TaxID=261302 RepID=UPI0038BBA09B
MVSADLAIGSVLIPGGRGTQASRPQHDRGMKAGSVVVGGAIDQGGCFETSVAITHAEPTFVVDGVIHYCMANMPGAVARTSTLALNNATIGHATAIARRPGRRQCAGTRVCAQA